MCFWPKMPRKARLLGDLTLEEAYRGEAYQGDPDRGTNPGPGPLLKVFPAAWNLQFLRFSRLSAVAVFAIHPSSEAY